jgi:hypothetical protein
MKIYKQLWQDHVQRDLPGYEYHLSQDIELAFNNKSNDLCSSCLDYFGDVIKLEISNGVAPNLAAALAHKSVALAEKVETAKRYNPYAHVTSWSEQSHLVSERSGRAKVCQVLAFGRAVLNKADLDRDLLREASLGYEFGALSVTKGNWDEPAQWQYHDAVFLALAAGDIERASTLMNIKKSFKWTKAMHDPLNSVVTNIAHASGHQLDPQSPEGQAFQSYFDDLRNPNWNEIKEKYGQTVGSMIYAAFHLALVKERFVTGNMGAPDWRRVFDSIAE